MLIIENYLFDNFSKAFGGKGSMLWEGSLSPSRQNPLPWPTGRAGISYRSVKDLSVKCQSFEIWTSQAKQIAFLHDTRID